MIHRTHFILIVRSWLLLLAASEPGFAQPDVSGVLLPDALLRQHLAALTAPNMAGRETGTVGQRVASLYCAQMFRNNRLEPAFQLDSLRFSFRQTYAFSTEEIRPYGASGQYGSQTTVARTYKRYALAEMPRTARDSADVRFGHNVAALLVGTDLKQEVVVVSAHYDHLGRVDGTIHPGADDNASGTATVLGVAAVFDSLAQAGIQPRRSILFTLFSGEEGGLIGSAFFVLNCPVLPTQLVADLNVDMVGRVDWQHRRRRDYCYILAGKADNFLRETVAGANQRSVRLLLDRDFDSDGDPNAYFYRSDQYNFFKAGVPALFFMDGSHPDYHRPSDTADRIEYDVLQKRATLVFQTAWLVANPTN
jgi:hypothetical protein